MGSHSFSEIAAGGPAGMAGWLEDVGLGGGLVLDGSLRTGPAVVGATVVTAGTAVFTAPVLTPVSLAALAAV